MEDQDDTGPIEDDEDNETRKAKMFRKMLTEKPPLPEPPVTRSVTGRRFYRNAFDMTELEYHFERLYRKRNVTYEEVQILYKKY